MAVACGEGIRPRRAVQVLLTLGAMCVAAGGIEAEQAEAPTEFVETGKGQRLAVRRWRPAAGSRPRAVLILVHGAQTHSAYFVPLGRALAAAGFECVAFDQQGAGHSSGESPWGFVDGLGPLADGLGDVIAREQRNRSNDTQFFVLGDGVGAVVVLHHAFRRRPSPEVSGYLLSGPLFRPRRRRGRGMLMAALKVLSVLRPKMQFSGSNKSATEDQRHSFFFPNGFPRFARPAFELLEAGSRIFSSAPAIQWPVAIFCGASDTLIDVADCKNVFETSTSMDKVLKVYEGGTSQLLEDSEEVSSRFIDDVKSWLDQRSNRRTAATPALDALLKKSARASSSHDECPKKFANSESDGSGSCRCKNGWMMGAAGLCVPEDASRGGGRDGGAAFARTRDPEGTFARGGGDAGSDDADREAGL